MEARTPEREFDLITGEQEAAVPDRNVAMELVRVTEYGALAAARWIGKGEKELADKAAVDAMRLALNNVSMDGVVVIGEGEKDEAPMLYNGEQIGDGSPPQVDIAVDPLEGTELTAKGFPNALAVIALVRARHDVQPGPRRLHGEDGHLAVARARPRHGQAARRDRQGIAKERACDIGDVIVIMLDRPRHEEQVKEIREAGARIRFILHGDVAASILAAQEGSPVDLLWGIGGTPEGVISACAIKCLGGQILGRLWPRNDEEKQAIIDAGLELDEVLDRDRLVAGENAFFAATGVTDGDVLEGVRYLSSGAATTESLAMRSKSGTVRRIAARHDRAKLRRITGERVG